MDEHRFDQLARALAQPRTRRWTLGALATAVGGALGLPRRAGLAGEYGCVINTVCCGYSCQGPDADRDLPGTCYNPEYFDCVDAENGFVCPKGETICLVFDRLLCRTSDQCCLTNKYCDAECCTEDERCVYAGNGRYECSNLETGCFRSEIACGTGCCPSDQICEDGACKDKPDDTCGAGRGAAARAACCDRPDQISCGDQCCSRSAEVCCGGGNHQTCCPKDKTCCPGANGVACCNPQESFCCSGTCCANHWTCDSGICREQCSEGKTKCGIACCDKDFYCSDAAQNICSRKCQVGQTPCGSTECCLSDQRCDNGKCVTKCEQGQSQCGTSCCSQNQQCKDGQCVKKKRRARKKHGRH